MQFVKPMLFREAVSFLGNRMPIASEMTSAEWQDVPVELRLRAEFSSEVESIRFLQRSRDWLGDFLSGAREDGPLGTAGPTTMLKVGSRAQFVELARQFALSEGMGPLVPEDAGTVKDITSEKRLSLIFNVQTQQADDYGYWRQGMNPDVLNEFPAQRFIRVKAVKQEREAHVPFEDQVYLKTDPIWTRINEDFGVPWGPWGWGCGHDVEDVDRQETISLGLISPGEEVVPETRLFNENLRASAAGLDPDLLAKLKNEFGEQLVIEGDEMRWAARTETSNFKPQTSREVEIPSTNEPESGRAGVSAPVSDAIEIAAAGTLRESVKTALAAIDRVHDDGVLPRIKLLNTRQSDFGFLRPKVTSAGIGTDFIAVRSTGPWPALTAVHELGHFLDIEAIGAVGNLATRAASADMLPVLAAAEKTAAVKGLRQQLTATINADTRHHVSYLLKPEEIWARAYAQFIAERAGNITLRNELRMAFDAERFRQWDTADFAPVAKEIETMFRKLGWL